MICNHCGKEVEETDMFCAYCGGALEKKETVEGNRTERTKVVKKKKSRIGLILGLIGGGIFLLLSMCVVGIFVMRNIFTVNSAIPGNQFKKNAKEFVKYLNEGDYDSAEELLDYDYYVVGNFKKFAEENLQNCKLKKTADGYTLVSDQGSYQLSPNENGYGIISEDFIMEYQIKYCSFLSSSHNVFSGMDGEELGDGMTLYTLKAYKSHEIEFYCDVILGETDNLTPQITVKAKTDENYHVCEITNAYDYLDSSVSYDGAYLEEDGTIVLDLYYITEEYSAEIANTFSNYVTDLANSALSGESYEDFSARNENYIFGYNLPRDEYDAMSSNRDTYLLYFDRVEVTSQNWEYPEEFRYSNGEYVLHDTVTKTAYKGDVKKNKITESHYVLFKPGDMGFKVYQFADTKDGLYTQ